MKETLSSTWRSPISAEGIASGSIQFSEIQISGSSLFWLERRPLEKGRTALMSWSESDGEKELLSPIYNVRSRVHEYGGGALLVDQNRIFFINDSDQQIYRLENGETDQITAQKTARFADGSAHGSSLYYVREEHGDQTINTIVQIDLKDGSIKTVASGADFYSNPRISPDGTRLAFICWNHPNMPWDGTELWILDLKSGQKKPVAGGASESIADPSWDPEGKLYYISDRSGWWNLYINGKEKSLHSAQADFCLPQWVFNRALYGFDQGKIVCSFIQNGKSGFGILLPAHRFETLSLPYTFASAVSIQNGKMGAIVSSPTHPPSILLYNLETQKQTIIKQSRSSFPVGFASIPQTVSFPSANGRIAHGFYYPPANPEFQLKRGEKPPLIVHVHGGPTAYDPPTFNPSILYWTSRGIGYIAVNYGGSSGYGRAYRELLNGKWGIVDVEDCTRAALYCVEQGLADPHRIGIEGGSSGGYTTLEALSATSTFQVGADYYGVSDLERLALDTHKFESRYLDRLIGPYPKDKALYLERSPVHHADQIKSPVIIFQGDEDAIVPPSQSEEIYKSLLLRKIPTAYLLFKGEQHGFRQAENIRKSLEAQLYFFAKIWGLTLSDSIPKIEIENIKSK